MEEYITACPGNCCSTCSFRMQVENDRIIRILPFSDINCESAVCMEDCPTSAYSDEEEVTKSSDPWKKIKNEWFLIIFSFLSTISVSTIITSLVRGVFPDKYFFMPVLLLAMSVPLFHFGRKRSPWRSVMNIKSSSLRREIISLIIYAIVSSITVFFHLPGFMVATSIIGLVFLLSVDSIYIYADRNKSVILHSGQTFFSALIIVSFFSGMVLPFIFMALIKLALSVYHLYDRKTTTTDFEVRFLRIALLVVSGISMISHISFNSLFIVAIFLIAEFLDRIIFYIDFNLMNITTMINEKNN